MRYLCSLSRFSTSRSSSLWLPTRRPVLEPAVEWCAHFVLCVACRIVVKKNKDATKFKARGPRSLVTLVLKDQKKAEKLIASLKRTAG